MHERFLMLLMKYMRILLLIMMFLSLCDFVGNKALCRTICVSSSMGNDTNEGNKQNPVQSIKRAVEKGDTILLKCGDIFYESVYLSNCYLSFYDQGEFPIICGYKRIQTTKWDHAGRNIWRILLKGNGFS